MKVLKTLTIRKNQWKLMSDENNDIICWINSSWSDEIKNSFFEYHGTTIQSFTENQSMITNMDFLYIPNSRYEFSNDLGIILLTIDSVTIEIHEHEYIIQHDNAGKDYLFIARYVIEEIKLKHSLIFIDDDEVNIYI